MSIRALIRASGLQQLDGELLIGHILRKPRSWLIGHDDETLTQKQLRQWELLLGRRKLQEPVAYIIGEKEFFGRTFEVTPDVLIPRPATEGLVELALTYLRTPQALTVPLDEGISAIARPLHSGAWEELVDAGTGSGCIAITIALEQPESSVLGMDTSESALIIAKRNAAKLQVHERVRFIHADAMQFVANRDRPFVLLSNPPYIPERTPLPPSVERFEPHAALFAGTDGLQVIRPLLIAAAKNTHCKGVIVEMRNDQVKEADRILETEVRVVS